MDISHSGFQIRSSFPPRAPIEPFIDEALEPKAGNYLLPTQLQLPAEPLTKQNVQEFLEGLKPTVEHVHKLSRQDLQHLNDRLKSFDQVVLQSSLPSSIKNQAQEIYGAYNQFLAQMTPSHQGKVLYCIEQLNRVL